MTDAAPSTRPSARQTEPANRKEKQTAAAKAAICAAVIECLDAYGYAETSINRIIETAGVSRGALTHHFPSKEALIVETAGRLLTKIMDPDDARRRHRGETETDPQAQVSNDLMRLWKRIVNTPAGRAWLEILTASRTDKALRAQIGNKLRNWNDLMNDQVGRSYVPTDVDDDVRTLWTICRIFMRGMLTHQSFAPEDDHLEVINRFIDLISPHMKRRPTEDPPQ